MADFGEERYASYVQVCRELRLDREFRPGDWLVVWDAAAQVQADPSLVQDRDDAQSWISIRNQFDLIWLPSLADWLEKLEAVGVSHIEFDPGIDDWHCLAIDLGEVGTADSREEAAARLWMAVTGHQPPPT